MFTFRRANKYVPIGKNFLLNKRTNREGYYFKKDIASCSHVIGYKGSVPERRTEAENCAIPMFEIACHPVKRYEDNLFSMRRAIYMGKMAIKKTEDTEIFNSMRTACRKSKIVETNNLSMDDFFEAFALIQEHDLDVKRIAIHPCNVEKFKHVTKEYFKPNFKWLAKRTGCIGTLLGAKVYKSLRMYPDEIFFSSHPRVVGVIPRKGGIKKKRIEMAKELREGYICWEKIGIAIANDYTISKIKLEKTDEYNDMSYPL